MAIGIIAPAGSSTGSLLTAMIRLTRKSVDEIGASWEVIYRGPIRQPTGIDMATRPTNRVIDHLRRAALLRDGAGLSDGQLLECFIRRGDEAAFEAIVRRHGSLVMGVCRRVLRHRQDAEDAFQATFLVLVRKAASIASRELLANWLYGVAYNTARKAQAAVRKRQHRERQVAEMPEPAAPPDLWNDLQAVLDDAVSRLPAKYRLPILLCDVEGHSRKDAARQLGWPEGSVSSRLARGRALLARRLARQGVGLSSGALAAFLCERAAAVVPASVVGPTIQAAGLVAGPGAAAGLLSAQVLTLTDGVLKTMMLTKLKIVAVACLAVAVVGGGAGGLLYRTQAAEEPRRAGATAPAVADKPAADERAMKEAEIQRQLRALKLLELQLTAKLNALKKQEQAEAILKRLREELRAKEKAVEQQRLRRQDVDAVLEQVFQQVELLEAQQRLEEVLKQTRDTLAKKETITKAVQEIEKAIKKLRETTGDPKIAIEALGEIQKAVEAMKSAARDLQDLNDVESAARRLLKDKSRGN